MLIIGAELLKNAKQPCVKEAQLFIKNSPQGRKCPLYATLLFRVNSLMINNNVNFVSRCVTQDLINYTPENCEVSNSTEFRFILEVSLKYRLPTPNYQLPDEQWTWENMTRFIDEGDKWVCELESGTNYIIKVDSDLQKLRSKYQTLTRGGQLESVRTSNKEISYVLKTDLNSLSLIEEESGIGNTQRKLMSTVRSSKIDTFEELLGDAFITVPDAYTIAYSNR